MICCLAFFGGHFMGHVFYENVARQCRWDGQKQVGFIHVFFSRTVGQISRTFTSCKTDRFHHHGGHFR